MRVPLLFAQKGFHQTGCGVRPGDWNGSPKDEYRLSDIQTACRRPDPPDVHVVGHGQFGGKAGIITLRIAQTITPGDLTGEGIVDITDLFQLLAAWGNCNQPCPPNCPADVNQDCDVNVRDLFMLLANWTS